MTIWKYTAELRIINTSSSNPSDSHIRLTIVLDEPVNRNPLYHMNQFVGEQF